MALLSVRQLVKHFPIAHGGDVVHAVNDVSFDIEPGESLALVGESGSGKTTVGRCILRLVDATSGRIDFMGQDITRIRPADYRRLRSKLQLVFQEPYEALNPRWPIGESIMEPLVYAGELELDERGRRRRVFELMEMVHMSPDDYGRFPHQLSGGQLQRVGIARAIATQPRLVVLDEPTSALDISVRAEIIELLIRLQRETQMAYLFISHDLTAVRKVSRRVAVMYLGRIVETAATDAIFAHQVHPYTKALLSSVLLPDPNQQRSTFRLSGEIPSPIRLPGGCFLAPRCPLRGERCGTSVPELEPVGPERAAACFRSADILGAGGVEDLVRLDDPSRSRSAEGRHVVGR
jgi:oligopeptide/dipeptide ABC transporter ATP-binding protein